VEGDASSASYFLAGATITGGTVTVEGCGSDSLQGDVRFAGARGRAPPAARAFFGPGQRARLSLLLKNAPGRNAIWTLHPRLYAIQAPAPPFSTPLPKPQRSWA
jgi:hypothetical protein